MSGDEGVEAIRGRHARDDIRTPLERTVWPDRMHKAHADRARLLERVEELERERDAIVRANEGLHRTCREWEATGRDLIALRTTAEAENGRLRGALQRWLDEERGNQSEARSALYSLAVDAEDAALATEPRDGHA